jgi:hypothetical protein
MGAPAKDRGSFPEPDGCLMIFGGSEDDCSKCKHKVCLWEVCTTRNTFLKFLRWSCTPITFDRGDHPPSVPRPGSYPLIVDPIIGNKHLTKVLMDEGSSHKIQYVETLDAMGISWSKLRTSVFPFLGILPSMRAYPLGNIDLPVTFSDHSNFHIETLIFEVVDFEGSYHAILGCLCYAKFMAVRTPTSS